MSEQSNEQATPTNEKARRDAALEESLRKLGIDPRAFTTKKPSRALPPQIRQALETISFSEADEASSEATLAEMRAIEERLLSQVHAILGTKHDGSHGQTAGLLKAILLGDKTVAQRLKPVLDAATRELAALDGANIEKRMRSPRDLEHSIIMVSHLSRAADLRAQREEPRHTPKPNASERARGPEETAELDSQVRDIFKGIVERPEDIDEMMRMAKARLARLDRSDPKVRAELREVVDALRDIERALSAPETTPEHIAAWAQEALEHWGDAKSEAVDFEDERNPLKRIAAIRTPIVSGTFEDLAKDIAKLERRSPKQIAPYGNVLTQSLRYGAMGATLGATAITFLLGKESANNALLKLIQSVKDNPTVTGIASAPLTALGIEPSVELAIKAAGYSAPAIILAAMLLFIPNRANVAPGLLGRLHTRQRFIIALSLLGFASSNFIFESIGGNKKKVDYGVTLENVVIDVDSYLVKIPDIIMKAQQNVVRNVLAAALKESKDGFGKKTMAYLYAGGLLHPDFQKMILADEAFVKSLPQDLQTFLRMNYQAEFDRFASTRPQQRKDWDAMLLRFQKAGGEKMGFQNSAEGMQALQVFSHLVAVLQDAKSAEARVAALATLKQGVGAAKRSDALKELVRSLHIAAILPKDMAATIGVEEIPNLIELEAQRDRMTDVYGRYLETYERLRGTDMAGIAEHIRAIAQASGLPAKDAQSISQLADLFKLDALPISAKGLRDKMAAAVAPKIETAIEVLTSESGWEAINESIQKTGLNEFLARFGVSLDLMNKETLEVFGTKIERGTAERIAVVLTTLTLYALLIEWLVPEFAFIKTSDAMRSRRFNREIRKSNEDIDELAHGLAESIVDRIDAVCAKSADYAGRREYGNSIGRDVRIAHVRGRLSALMLADLEKNPPPGNALTEEIAFLRSGEVPSVSQSLNRITSLALSPIASVLEVALSFKQRPLSVAMKNAQIRWYREKSNQLRSGNPVAMMELTRQVYPSFDPAVGALTAATFADSPTEKMSAAGRLREAARAMSLQELVVAIPEVSLQLAVLERGARELEERGVPELLDVKPIRAGERLEFSQTYIDQAFVLGSIRDDIKRYRHMLKDMRAEGRKIILETGQGALPNVEFNADGIPSIFEDRTDNAWINADLSRDQRDSLVRLMRERLGFLESESSEPLPGSFSLPDFTEYVNDMAQRAQPLLEQFKRNADASDRPRLIAKNFFLGFGYSPLVQGPTLLLYAADPGQNPEAFGEDDGEVVSVPFPGTIPDSRGRTPEETLSDISEWLANGGGAMNNLEAQLMEVDMKRVERNAQKSIIESYSLTRGQPVRIPLTDDSIAALLQKSGSGTQTRFESTELATIARLRHARSWLSEHAMLLEGAYLGIPITPERMQGLAIESLQATTSDESSYYVVVERMRTMVRMLEMIRARLPELRKGRDKISVSYDPKSTTQDEIIFTKGKGKNAVEERVRVDASEETLDKAIAKLRTKGKAA